MMKMMVGYPDRADENEILQRRINRKTDEVEVNSITDPSIVVKMQKSCEEVYVDRSVREYMVDIVARTREDPRVLVGSSPRGSQALLKTSRAVAAMRGRDFVTPDDVKSIAELAVAHRIILKPEHQIKGLETGEVIRDILHGKNAANVPTVRILRCKGGLEPKVCDVRISFGCDVPARTSASKPTASNGSSSSSFIPNLGGS